MPLFDPNLGHAEIGATVSQSWDFVLAYQSTPSKGQVQGAAAKPAAPAKVSKKSVYSAGLDLTIEPLGKQGIVLAIRAAK